MKIKSVFFLLALVLASISLAYAQTEKEMEKDDVYNVLVKVNSWYQEGYVRKRFFPNEEWYLTEKEIGSYDYEKNNNGYRLHLKKRIEELKTLDIFTDDLIIEIEERYKDIEIVNEGIMFTDHNYGDCITSFLVTRQNMDYLITESPDYNFLQEQNTSMSEDEFKNWHKERIVLINGKNAIYKVFYSEVGFQTEDRGNSILEIELVKDISWKINSIKIIEPEREKIMEFYNQNIKRRGYFKN